MKHNMYVQCIPTYLGAILECQKFDQASKFQGTSQGRNNRPDDERTKIWSNFLPLMSHNATGTWSSGQNSM